MNVDTLTWSPLLGLDAKDYHVAYECEVAGSEGGGEIRIEVPLPTASPERRYKITVTVTQLGSEASPTRP